jgi:2-polyprenyl-3-methyl-5-hydroxy-6-metoxy-1,4-benzoquinol methylase
MARERACKQREHAPPMKQRSSNSQRSPFGREPESHETLRRMAAAENYNAWLLERSRPHLGQRVLDVGAGIGTFSESLSSACELVVAAEPDPELASALKRRFASRSNVMVVEIDAESFADAALPRPFDSVVCFNVLEHIADDAGALDAFRAQLRPGGKLLLLVPAHPALFGSADRMLGHERRYRKSVFRALLTERGFATEVLRHVNPVGALGWLVSGRLLHREQIPEAPLRAFDRLVPVLRMLDRVELPFGLSLWAVARRA